MEAQLASEILCFKMMDEVKIDRDSKLYTIVRVPTVLRV
jgi:hypothetical protein